MRPVRITTDYLMTAEGSALIEVGNTRVLCAASVEWLGFCHAMTAEPAAKVATNVAAPISTNPT